MSRPTEQREDQSVETIDIYRRPIRLSGSIHDINRVMQACRTRLAFIEHNQMDPSHIYVVAVRAPQSDEP